MLGEFRNCAVDSVIAYGSRYNVLVLSVGVDGVAYVKLCTHDPDIPFMNGKWFLVTRSLGRGQETPLEFMQRNMSNDDFWMRYAGDREDLPRMSRNRFNNYMLMEHMATHVGFHKKYHLTQALGCIVSQGSMPREIRHQSWVTAPYNKYVFPAAFAKWFLERLSENVIIPAEITQIILAIVVNFVVKK